MYIYRLFTAQSLQAGLLSGVQLDTISNASTSLHPAIEPGNTLNTPATYQAPGVAANTSGNFPTTGTNAYTGKANRITTTFQSLIATGGPASPNQVGLYSTVTYGDQMTIQPPTNAVLVQIQFAGMLQAGQGFKAGDTPDGTDLIGAAMVHNGAQVAVSMDTNAPIVYDTYNQTISVSVNLDGVNQHAILLQHAGIYNPAAPVLGAPVAGTGTSIVSGLVVQPTSAQSPALAASSLLRCLWTIQATSSTQFEVLQTLPGGSPTTIATGLTTNTIYDSSAVIPGVKFHVQGTLTIGDTATFTTDSVNMTIQQISIYTATGSVSGLYSTPIMDSGNPETQWFLYEHTESYFPTNPTTNYVLATIGNTLQTLTVAGNSPTYQGGPTPISWLSLPYMYGALQSEVPQSGLTPLTYPRLINANPNPVNNTGALSYSTILDGTPFALNLHSYSLPTSQERRNDGGLMFQTTAVGNLLGQSSFATPGLQTGVEAVSIAGVPVAGYSMVIDTQTAQESVQITSVSGTGPYYLSFTTTKTHATSGDIFYTAQTPSQPSGLGQYCQFTISLANATTGIKAWARDFQVWSWVPTPQGDPQVLAKIALPPNWLPGPNMQAYLGAISTFFASFWADVYNYNNSFVVGSSVDQYLINHGIDVKQPVVTGEPSSAYQNRLSNFVQAKSTANAPLSMAFSGTGTLSTPVATINSGTGITTVSPVSGDQSTLESICEQLSTLLNGTVPTVTRTYVQGSPYVTASGGGVSVTQLGNRGVSITLPNPPYLGLPGLATGTNATTGVDNPAKAIIKAFCVALMPVGSAFNANSSTYLNFNTLG